ncbi:MAG: thiamine pyrophosphate-dependent enzyme, partial [Candidatus Caenarcaniphilales bacterium]|nr:thiamine pyrophosphate-dependent enzyme [Candidatus Caenarcaniphilales bacterium]
IHLDIDPAEVGKNRKIIPGVDVSLLGDAKKVLQELLKTLNKRKGDTKEWLEKVKSWEQEYPLDEQESEEFLTPSLVFRLLNETMQELGEEAIYTTDVGQHQMWAAQYLKIKSPRKWITSGGLGTMGFGLPAAIGAKAAVQDLGMKNPVVCISGDGSFQMCQQEIGTMVAHQIPVVTIILNNGNLGMVRQWQELFYNRNYSFSDLRSGTPDYAKLAEAYGIKGLRVASPKNLREIIKNAIQLNQPIILDLEIHPEANVFPIVPPGGSNHRAEGIGLSTIPANRNVEEYDKDVLRAPVNEISRVVTTTNKKKISDVKHLNLESVKEGLKK